MTGFFLKDHLDAAYLICGLIMLALMVILFIIRKSEGRLRSEMVRRQEVEALATESQEKYRNLVEMTTDIIYISSADGKQAFMNEAAYKILGYTPEEVIGHPWTKIVHPEDREKSFRKFSEMISQGSDAFNFENRYLSKSGKVIDVLHNVRLLRNSTGEIVGTQGIARDITKLKKTQDEMRRRIGMERIISDLSSHFVSLKQEDLEKGITLALERIGAFCGAERSSLFLFSDKGRRFDNTHEWHADTIDPFMKNLKSLSVSDFPWIMEKLHQSEAVCISSGEESPREARTEAALFLVSDAGSLVLIPITYGGSLTGFLALSSEGEKQVWFEDDIKLLKLSGELISVTLRRLRAEENLRLFSEAIEAAMDGIQIVGLDGQILYSNRAVEKIYGFRASELAGKHVNEMNADRGFAENAIFPAIQRYGHWNGELLVVHKSGRHFPVLLSASIVKNGIGEPIAMIGIIRDISERRKEEQELREHRERLVEMVEERTSELKTAVQLLTQEIAFRKNTEESLKESESNYRQLLQEFHTLLDAIPDYLLLVSSELKVLWANKSAAEQFSRNVSELSGQHCYALWHNRTKPCDNCHVLKSFLTGEAESSRRTTYHGRILDSRAFPIKNDDGSVSNVIIVISDVTEKTRLQAETLRAGHLASIGELAAGVAHEINNPINGIINYAQMLANKAPAGTADSDIANRIIREGDRIAVIVRGLLSFARERKEEKVSSDVEKILYDSLTLVGTQLRKDGIHLKTDVPPDLPHVIANPQQIQQVFLNIINNARYALNEKYKNACEAKRLQISAERVTRDKNSFVRTSFYDRGTGIPGEILDKVINPFFSTKPGGEGTGLGLSISHGIVKDHGGRLTIESVAGEFTRVLIELPEGYA